MIMCQKCGRFFKPKTPRQKYCKERGCKNARAVKKYSSRFGQWTQEYQLVRLIKKSSKKLEKEIKNVYEIG